MSSGPTPGSATNDPTPTFRFSSSEPGSTFECRYGSQSFSACSGSGSDTPSSPLSDGPQTFYVKAIDAANNRSQALRRAFSVDTVAPKVSIDGPRRIRIRRGSRGRATFILKASEQAALRCRIDARPFRSCSSPYRTPRLRHGLHRLKVKAADEAGNVGQKRKRFRIVRRPARTASRANVSM
jgi:hypothetical protein